MNKKTSITTLDENFKKEFGISQVFESKSGSQKDVYIIERNNIKCVLKLFRNFGIRDLRELDIYDKYNNLKGIPKIIEIKKHHNDTIVFEEYINGRELEEVISYYKNDCKKNADLILKIIHILTPLWKDGIVHRDLKPSNIIVTDTNDPVVIDFGIAKNFDVTSCTTLGFQPHTCFFAAPEQILADKDKISYRTDFFSLGIISFYIHHHRLPFGDTREKIEKLFSTKKLAVNFDKDYFLSNALIEILKFNPSDRPAKIENLIKLFTI